MQGTTAVIAEKQGSFRHPFPRTARVPEEKVPPPGIEPGPSALLNDLKSRYPKPLDDGGDECDPALKQSKQLETEMSQDLA